MPPVARQKMVPHHVEGNWRYAAVGAPEIVAAGFHLRQAVGQHVDAAVHRLRRLRPGLVVGGGLPRTKSASRLLPAASCPPAWPGEDEREKFILIHKFEVSKLPPYFLPLTAPALD